MPENLGDKLLEDDAEKLRVTLKVEPESGATLPDIVEMPSVPDVPEVPGAQELERLPKPEIGYSTKSIDYSQKSLVRMSWNYFYILLLAPLFIFIFLWLVGLFTHQALH